ncbi:MAG: class II aldolase/adducin family protein [Clostridia bacterium]|nr:class II aldolase/adducin family protein [Clostridia bacterium]
MLYQKERELIVKFCNLMVSRSLTKGTGGNISIRCDGGRIAISPSGVDYAAMSAADVVIVDFDGATVDGNLLPSSETQMHLGCYRKRPDIGAVVHTHSTFATVLACMRLELKPIHYLIGYAGKTVPCIDYYPFGSMELAEAAGDAMKKGNAVLLGNHGLLAAGRDIDYAFSTAEETEFVCELYYRTLLLGGGTLLDEEQMEDVARRFERYGQKQRKEDL